MPTGRQSSNVGHEIALANPRPVPFRKDGVAAAGALPGRWYNATDRAQIVRNAHVSAGTAPAGSALTVDVKVDGSSVFAAAADRPKIAAGANAGEAAPNKFPEGADHVELAPGSYLTVEITGVGSGTAGSDVVVQVLVS